MFLAFMFVLISNDEAFTSENDENLPLPSTLYLVAQAQIPLLVLGVASRISTIWLERC